MSDSQAGRLFAAAIGGLAISGTVWAGSVDISFTRISSNAAENVESQLLATLTTVTGDSSKVDFIFTNDVGMQSSISEIYFDNGNPAMQFASGSIHAQVGTSFTFGGANPSNLPGHENVTPSFNATVAFSSDASGNPSNGINTNTDSLTIRIMLLSGLTFDDVVEALGNGELRIGLHVRSVGANQDSDAFVNDSPPEGPTVPAPSPLFLGAAGLSAVVGLRRRR